MTDAYEFPTELTELGSDPETPGDVMRWTITILSMSTFGLALLNPGSIGDWVNDLPPTSLTLRLASLSDAYVEGTGTFRLDALHARMHAAWKFAERTDWSGRQPVETAEASKPRS